jgi:hypothetical protein
MYMKGVLLIFTIASIVLGNNKTYALDFHTNKKLDERIRPSDIDEAYCYQASYAALSDSLLASWERIFVQEGIADNPFAMMIYVIDHFSAMDQAGHDRCMSLDDIVSFGQTNVRSSIIATCALMRRLGWDMLFFFHNDEMYLGICFSDGWKIMAGQGAQREADGKVYLWKDFDTYSQVGAFRQTSPVSEFKSLDVSDSDVDPFPLISTLPWFTGEYYKRQLTWRYKGKAYAYTVRIPEQQITWTGNLPSSLFGIAASGVLELRKTGLTDYLQQLVHCLSEYERVNFLLKFCQSEGVFRYEDQPIMSVSRQLQEACNDCDSRSVFLYCLLRTVMDYTDDDIVFVMWPEHLALSVRPRTDGAFEILKKRGYRTHDDFFVLDPTYTGKTFWGSKMDDLPDSFEIIAK